MKKYLSILMIAVLTVFASCNSDDKDKTVYTVTFETDGGTPFPSVQRVEEGSMATAPSTNPTKTGYAFVFWHLSGTTTAYNFQTPVNRDIILQAKWQEEATAEYWKITWNLNGGVWPSDDNHVTQVLRSGTLIEPATPTKSGSTFEGWYKESALTNKVTFPYDVSAVTTNFTLYAKWETEGGGSTDPEGYVMFTSISDLKSWLASQLDNGTSMPYNVGLKNVNLDTDSNWDDLGNAIGFNKTKLVNVDLSGCTGTAIPDGKSRYENGYFIFYDAFINCDNLLSIKLPPGLTSIGWNAFRDCGELVSVVLPESIKTIGNGAFRACEELRFINFPEGLETIGTYTFTACRHLGSVICPKSLQSIGEYAFNGCYDLAEFILLPATPPVMGNYVFHNTSSSLKINVPEESVDIYKAASGWKDYADKIGVNIN